MEMRYCLLTVLLAGFLVVHGCASQGDPTPVDEGAGAGQTPAGVEDETADATPQDGTAGDGDATADGDGTADSEAPAAPEVVRARGSERIDKPTRPVAGEPVKASAPGGSTVADVTPVGSAATEVQRASTEARAQTALLTPRLARDTAPEVFRVRFTTTKGDFVVEAHRSWAPNGADRLYNLAKIGFFNDVAFFRVMKNFVVQFGIHGDPDVSAAWLEAAIDDDEVIESNTRGMVSFADRRVPDTRTTQLFINLAGMNSYLDEEGYAPVGRVIEGMDVVDSLYSGYGDGSPRGSGPSQATIQSQGNEYLKRDFPNLDYIRNAEIVE